MQQVIFLAKPEGLRSGSKHLVVSEDDLEEGEVFLKYSSTKFSRENGVNDITHYSPATPAETMSLHLNLQLPRIMRSSNYMTVPWRKKENQR